MQSIYDTVSKDYLISSSFDDHPYVQKFNSADQNDNDYKQTLINAYIVRDIMYNGNKTLGQVMSDHCKKLGLNPSEEDIQNKRKYEFTKNIKEMASKQEFVEETIKDYYFSIMNQNETENEISNKEKYNTIMSSIENGAQIEEVYNHFSVEDLGYIGW